MTVKSVASDINNLTTDNDRFQVKAIILIGRQYALLFDPNCLVIVLDSLAITIFLSEVLLT